MEVSHSLLIFYYYFTRIKTHHMRSIRNSRKYSPYCAWRRANNYLFLHEFGSVYISKFLNEGPSFFLAKNQSFIFHIPLNLGETSPSVSIFFLKCTPKHSYCPLPRTPRLLFFIENEK